MDYNKLSKEQLIERIEELELLNKHLLDEKEKEVRLDFAWTGNLGHWYWNIKTNTVTFNMLKVKAIGYSKEEVPKKTNYQFFTDKLHPDDYENTMNVMKSHLKGETNIYEVEYRIKTKDGGWKWFYDRGKITEYDKDGKPLFMSGIVFDITDKKEMQMELISRNKLLEELSLTDELTKLKNNRAVISNMSIEIEKANQYKKPLSIGIFDIDDFKLINDTRGHLTGDNVLRQIAEIMKRSLRESDIVGRYGGEEFLVIFPNTEGERALSVANRIRLNVEEFDFGEDLKVTISGGIKEYKGETLYEIINLADKKLYLAKSKGKNKIIK